MIIYERDHDGDRKIEAIIPDEIKNTCGMIELVQKVLSAKHGTEEDIAIAKKNLAIASIKNSLADIIASESKKLVASIVIMKNIVDFMFNDCDGVVPEMKMISNDSNFLRHQYIRFLIREDVYADIRFDHVYVMVHEYDIKVSFFGKSGAPYGGWAFDSDTKKATYMCEHIRVPGVNEPDPGTVEFINNFMKKLCDNIGFSVTITRAPESCNDLDRYTNTNPIDIKENLPVPDSFKFQKNTMYGVCDNESDDDDDYDEYDEEYD